MEILSFGILIINLKKSSENYCICFGQKTSFSHTNFKKKHRHADSLDPYDSGDENNLHRLSTTLSKESTTTVEPSSTKVTTSRRGTIAPHNTATTQPQHVPTVISTSLPGSSSVIHGNVYNITISHCDKVSLPTSASQQQISLSPFRRKRVRNIIDSSPDNSQEWQYKLCGSLISFTIYQKYFRYILLFYLNHYRMQKSRSE